MEAGRHGLVHVVASACVKTRNRILYSNATEVRSKKTVEGVTLLQFVKGGYYISLTKGFLQILMTFSNSSS
jgi:hypothetical protein